jgi:hypothetical protein
VRAPLRAVRRFGDDIDVVDQLEQRPDAPPHQGLIVDEYQSNHCAGLRHERAHGEPCPGDVLNL